jgi:uncharacterized protein
MKIINSGLVADAEHYVMKLMDDFLPEEYLFHSKVHTLNVLRNAELIGTGSGLNEHEMNILRISALFHDTGYIKSSDNHEVESTLIAREFLAANHIDEQDAETVVVAILATRVPQKPTDKISMVLCDADLMHLTSDDYFEQMELLRIEWQKTGRYHLTVEQFHLNSVEFFVKHHYHSDYGKQVLEARKHRTLRLILDRIDFNK